MLCILTNDRAIMAKSWTSKKAHTFSCAIARSGVRPGSLPLIGLGCSRFPATKDLIWSSTPKDFSCSCAAFLRAQVGKCIRTTADWLSLACKHHHCCTLTSTDPALLDAGERLNHHRCSSRGGNVHMPNSLTVWCFFLFQNQPAVRRLKAICSDVPEHAEAFVDRATTACFQMLRCCCIT